jgi:hypothetical protein
MIFLMVHGMHHTWLIHYSRCNTDLTHDFLLLPQHWQPVASATRRLRRNSSSLTAVFQNFKKNGAWNALYWTCLLLIMSIPAVYRESVELSLRQRVQHRAYGFPSTYFGGEYQFSLQFVFLSAVGHCVLIVELIHLRYPD